MRNRTGSLLRGLVFCESCGCTMTHSCSQQGRKRYRYYVCTNAQKQGWTACPSPSLAAPEIERFVVEQFREIGRDLAIVAATLAATRAHA